MFAYTDTRRSVSEITTMFKTKKLIVDDSYQRRSVWSEKDKVRLVETILLKLVIPELFFWKSNTDPESGESTTHIVDGQQRIKAICSFVNNEFRLKRQYLLDEKAIELYGDKLFSELGNEEKREFWNYQLMVIDIDPLAKREDIINMFNRLNLTDYNLNDQEKRNSKSGDFAAMARALSDDEIWDTKHLFTATDVKRMKDVEFCASLILLYRKGIIDQTDQTELNAAYEDLHTGYVDAEKDKEAVSKAIEILQVFFISESAIKFLRRKAQLYTVFTIIFYSMANEILIDHNSLKNFQTFVDMYSLFSNDMEFDMDDDEKRYFDRLKKYKLASSEGLNKHTNRTIRFNVLKDFMFSDDEELSKTCISLMTKMENTKMLVEEDPDE